MDEPHGLSDGRMSFLDVEHEGRRIRVAVAVTDRGTWVGWRGGTVLVAPERQKARESAGGDDVVAPMTGKIVEVRAEVGAVVAADEVLVIMEAMKMEYRLTSPRAGEVRAVHCKPGALVDLGATLVVLGE